MTQEEEAHMRSRLLILPTSCHAQKFSPKFPEEKALSPHIEKKAAAAEKGDLSGALAPLHRQNLTGV